MPLLPRPALSLPTSVVRPKLLLVMSWFGTPHIGVFVRLKNSVRNSSLLPAPADGEAAEDREVDVPVAGSAELVPAGVAEPVPCGWLNGAGSK